MSRVQDPRNEVVTHLPALRAFAISLTRNSAMADDMVQDTIEKAWVNFDKFQSGTNMRAWLFTILRNTYYSNLRRAKREVADPEGAFVGQMSEKPAHDGALQLGEFRAALAELPPQQREALTLVGAEGFSYREAAEMCGCAVGTVKSRANRARRRLAELLNLSEEEPLEMTDPQTAAVVSHRSVGRV